jgi:carboxymethylenebutenolidase
MIRFTTLTAGGGPMTALVALPDETRAPCPALVLMPHRNGIDRYTIDRAERLAAEGIAAVAPDVYHRQPMTLPTSTGKDQLDDNEIEADIGAALAFLKADARVDNGRIGIMGHCQGGRTALVGLVTYPDDFCMGCIYYGGSIFKRMGGPGPAPFDRMGVIKGPIAGFFGNEDQNPSPADVDRFDAELTRLKIPHDFHRYDGAGHAFQDFTDKRRSREPQGAQAWETTLEFLRRELSLVC